MMQLPPAASTIAVIGATGAQGGGLVRALLADPALRFCPRALTRHPDSPAALALTRLGAEVVRADLDKPDTLITAFAGTQGVFAVTNFWEHHSPETERRQARHIAEAALRTQVPHLIWSTLEDTRDAVAQGKPRMPVLMGSYQVPHMDAKAEADAIFQELGVPTTFLHTSFYWENLLHPGMGLRRAADGVATLALPLGAKRLPGIAASDIGACASALFRQRKLAIGGRMGIAGEHLDGNAMAMALARVLDEPVCYEPVPFPQYARLGFPGAADLANMFQYKHDFNAQYRALRPVADTRTLYPGLLNFATWAERHAETLKLTLANVPA